MQVIICKDYSELSQTSADIIANEVTKNPSCVLGLATGSTPIGTYQELVKMYKAGALDFSDVTTFNLDEYYPISPINSQSYRYFMNDNLFAKINVNLSKTHVLSGECEDIVQECENFEDMIKEAGGIDLQLLGIGENGHIGFNEPDEYLHLRTHLTGLTENTIEVNSRFFDRIDDVPKKAITMGIATIFNARKIIILASGVKKHNIVTKLLEGKVSTSNPASILHLHNDVVLICDKQAYLGV